MTALSVPGANPKVSIPGYSVRPATLDDLPAINDLSKEAEFELGLATLRLFYTSSPQCWHVIVRVDTGELVCYNSLNQLTQDCYMGYHCVVKEGYRGRGLTRLLNSMSYSTYAVMGNATNDSLERYSFKHFQQKFITYRCRMSDSAKLVLRNGLIEFINGNVTVMEYDFALSRIERRKFMNAFLFDEKLSQSLVAVDNRTQEIKGYGCARLLGDDSSSSQYWIIEPLYADNDQMADYLLRELSLRIPNDNELMLHFPANKRPCRRLMFQLNGKFVEAEIRQAEPISFERIQSKIDWNRVYADHEYFPC